MKLKELFETFNNNAEFDTQSNWVRTATDIEMTGEIGDIKLKIQIEPVTLDGFEKPDNTIFNISFQILDENSIWSTKRKTITTDIKQSLHLLSCVSNNVVPKLKELIERYNIIGIVVFSKNDSINDNRGKIYQRLASRLKTELVPNFIQRNGKTELAVYTVLAPSLYIGKLIKFIELGKVD